MLKPSQSTQTRPRCSSWHRCLTGPVNLSYVGVSLLCGLRWFAPAGVAWARHLPVNPVISQFEGPVSWTHSSFLNSVL
ncbi:hypothetical protein QQF64_014898 [Cirrhinus molitorella]|uniref:Uncharacterized protein n=1 Tax=Cirrhinus molitorella TaxID=172907 RepID=A0ABR3NUG6_9TELE